MLLSDLPPTAVVVSTGVWSDSMSRTRYYLDPQDATLLTYRDWTAAEIDAYEQSVATLGSNQDKLTTNLKNLLTALKADIGPSTDPAGNTSLNAVLNETNANINSSPAKYLNEVAKASKRTDQALVALIKLYLNLVSDTDIGS